MRKYYFINIKEETNGELYLAKIDPWLASKNLKIIPALDGSARELLYEAKEKLSMPVYMNLSDFCDVLDEAGYERLTEREFQRLAVMS